DVRKSTFLAAATLAPVHIPNYPFTTIDANRGVAYVRKRCPHLELGHPCKPKNAPCNGGTRLIPVELLDVAGLVPNAHEGRGLGNKFLDDLRQANAFVHVIDATGGTDFEGNPVALGTHDPCGKQARSGLARSSPKSVQSDGLPDGPNLGRVRAGPASCGVSWTYRLRPGRILVRNHASGEIDGGSGKGAGGDSLLLARTR